MFLTFKLCTYAKLEIEPFIRIRMDLTLNS